MTFLVLQGPNVASSACFVLLFLFYKAGKETASRIGTIFVSLGMAARRYCIRGSEISPYRAALSEWTMARIPQKWYLKIPTIRYVARKRGRYHWA